MDESTLFQLFSRFATVSRKKSTTDLFRQLETARKVCNYNFCNEIIVTNFLNKLPAYQEEKCWELTEELKSNLNTLLGFVVQSFESNLDPKFTWLIHSIAYRLRSFIEEYSIEKYMCISNQVWNKFRLISDQNYALLALTFANKSLPSHLQFDEISALYRRLESEPVPEKDDCLQSILIKLRNSLYTNSSSASLVVDVLSSAFELHQHKSDSVKFNVFNQIYLQSLMHTLKNQNKPHLIEILLRCPDCIFSDEEFLCQIIDYFLSANPSNSDLLTLYATSLYRHTPLLIKFISNIRRSNYRYRSGILCLKSKPYFDLKECFLLAVYQKKHFINEFMNLYFANSQIDISNLPVKAQIIVILLSLYNLINTNQKDENFLSERVARFESSLLDLFVQYELESADHVDKTFDLIVEKFKFVFKFCNWCYEHVNYSKADRFIFRYKIIAALLTGSSPLKILSNCGFFEFKFKNVSYDEFKEEILCDFVCKLTGQYDQKEVMILKGFIVLRLIMFCIFSNENENIYFDVEQIRNLIQDLFPIDYRVEIMENMFSLLFLTRNDLNRDCNLNSSEDEDYLDETFTSTRRNSLSHKIFKAKRRAEQAEQFGNSSNFICPNWIIPKLLEVLKDILYKTNSDLFPFTYGENKEDELNLSGSCDNKEELKTRVDTLIKYVNDAQFRFDVIRPAFYKNSGSTFGENESSSDCASNDYSRCVSNSSDTDHKNQNNLKTSLISCMLASHTQLLCYTLIENRLESSKQIVQLFFDDLQDSNELKELHLLDHFTEFHSKMSNVYLNYSNRLTEENPAKISELANIGVKTSKVQSLIYEMLLKMENIDNDTKKYFLIDYALSSSPSLEITQTILESVFIQNNYLFFQPNSNKRESISNKIENFISGIYKLIQDLSQYLDIGQLSMGEFLEKSLTFDNLLDSQTFVSVLQNEINLKQSYFEFYSLLEDFEHRIIDEPNSSPGKLDEDAKRLMYHFDKIITHCPTGNFHYLKALYSYVRKVSKALEECRKRNVQSPKNTVDSSVICSSSHFSILKQSPSAILCSMVIKSKISPKIIDDLALIMKVNLIGVLCSVYCPPIPSTFVRDTDFVLTEFCHPSLSELVQNYLTGVDCSQDSNVVVNDYFHGEVSSKPVEMDTSFTPLINNDVLSYFYSKCSVLVEVLRLLNLVNELQLSNFTNTSSRNFVINSDSPLSKWIDIVKCNFYYGDLAATLPLAFYSRIPSGHMAVIKSLEHYASNHNFVQIYNLFRYIEDCSIVEPIVGESGGSSYRLLQNAIYSRLAFIKEDAKYVFQIDRDPKMKADLTLSLLTQFDNYDETFYATRLVRLCLQSISNDEVTHMIDATESKQKLENILREIEFYASVGQLTGLKTWKVAKENLESIDLLTIIKTKKRYPLAIDWHKIHGFDAETHDLHMELLIYAYSELNDYVSLRKLFHDVIDGMQSNSIISIVEKTINQVSNLDLRSFLSDLLISHHRKQLNYYEVDHYEQYKIGVEICKNLSSKIQADYLKLISKPMLIIEQLLMNSEIESLEKIINQCKIIKADDLVEKYALKSVYIELYESGSFHGSDITLISLPLTESSYRSGISFVVPEKIPSKEQWVSDTSETHCMLCQLIRFSMINRRHHCRRCGRVVCSNCSPNSFIIPEINTNLPVRVCNDCYSHLKLSIRKISTNSTDSNGSQTGVLANKRTNWLLNNSEDSFNGIRRAEFFYESAPSVTLCLAILRLHSNKKQCCKFIIDRICAPLLESTSSRSVDSTLLIEMIRSLLISTRISIEDGDDGKTTEPSQEIEQLNLYLDRLDVIRMMINSNYGTKEMIGLVLSNNIQKLQEKLIEIERFELAIDIAKKYGLDSSSIWKTWALICLKHFQFVEARRKFTRYFDQAKRFTEIQLTLKSIVNILVNNNMSNQQTTAAKDRCMQIISGKYDFFKDTAGNRQHLKPRIFQEIVYYLQEYGSSDDLLQFYVNHNYWNEATDCFLGKCQEGSTSSDLSNRFLQDLFVPAQTKGCLSSLLAAIRHSDPQLNSLWSYLIATCKYLDKNRFYNSLCRVQAFMNDYLRAAITQINCFFLNPNTELSGDEANFDSFDLLYHRMNHLEKARDYCNMYLHNMDYVKLKPGCLSVEKKDVFRQIRLIEFQMDVLRRFKMKNVQFPITIRLSDVESLRAAVGHSRTWPQIISSFAAYALHSLEERLSVSIGPQHLPPTLLEHDTIRKCLITSLIILHYCDSIEEGFRYSMRIIQDHELNSELVYRMAGSLLLVMELKQSSSNELILGQLNHLLALIRLSSGDEDSGPEFAPDSQSVSSTSIRSQLAYSLCDDIVHECIRLTEVFGEQLASSNGGQSINKETLADLGEQFIRLLSDDIRRIEAYLHTGKMKLAYLLAVSVGQRSIVARVLETARNTNDQHYVKICEMWLKKNITANSSNSSHC